MLLYKYLVKMSNGVVKKMKITVNDKPMWLQDLALQTRLSNDVLRILRKHNQQSDDNIIKIENVNINGIDFVPRYGFVDDNTLSIKMYAVNKELDKETIVFLITPAEQMQYGFWKNCTIGGNITVSIDDIESSDFSITIENIVSQSPKRENFKEYLYGGETSQSCDNQTHKKSGFTDFLKAVLSSKESGNNQNSMDTNRDTVKEFVENLDHNLNQGIPVFVRLEDMQQFHTKMAHHIDMTKANEYVGKMMQASRNGDEKLSHYFRELSVKELNNQIALATIRKYGDINKIPDFIKFVLSQ